jgi:hypothetical protein
MTQLAEESEQIVTKNYETEYQKIENISQVLIQMITDYKTRIQ